MGAGLLVLALGVVVLAIKMKGHNYVPPDTERYMVWIYDGADKTGPATVALIEESHSGGSLHALTFPAPDAARQAYGESPRKAQEALAALAGRQVHHRLFLPYSVVETLVDAAGGVTVGGKQMNGSAAVAYLKGGESRRAADLLLGLADQIQHYGIELTVSKGLSLARQVDTDLDLTGLPTLFQRWTSYPAPKVETPAKLDTASLDKMLLPDPPPETAKR